MDSENRCTWCVTLYARDVVVASGTELYARRRHTTAKRIAKPHPDCAPRKIRNAIVEKSVRCRFVNRKCTMRPQVFHIERDVVWRNDDRSTIEPVRSARPPMKMCRETRHCGESRREP